MDLLFRKFTRVMITKLLRFGKNAVMEIVNADNTVSTIDLKELAKLDSAGVSQELTASGAVTSGVQSLELNHASVVIAATIAVAGDHAGFFYVSNTSASGTAAHTVTLTGGTWDGTNTIATLNAPAESLLVFFDVNGAGRIILNTGAVALS